MSKVIHFEDLWEMAEKTSPQDLDLKEIIGQLRSSVEEIKDLYKAAESSKDSKLVQAMKSKAMGRLLVSLTALSAKDKIDVYAALKDQLDVAKIKELIDKA